MHDLHRRHFLQVTGSSLATGALAQGEASAEEQVVSGYIDAHSHIWTPDTARYPLAGDQTKAELIPPSFTTEELLRTVAPHSVERVVLIQHQIYYGWDNSYMTDAAEKHPDVFRVVATVNDRSPKPDREMRRLLHKHVTGFRITPQGSHSEQWLASSGMAAMWKCAAETRQPMCCLINPSALPSVDRMCEQFPETPVVLDHFARIGIDGKIRETDLQQLSRLARHKHTYVKVSAFYALGKKKPPYDDVGRMVRRVYDAFGPQRLMWASDCPYQLQGKHTYEASVSLIRDRLDFLSQEDRTWLLRKTADRVFFAGKA